MSWLHNLWFELMHEPIIHSWLIQISWTACSILSLDKCQPKSCVWHGLVQHATIFFVRQAAWEILCCLRPFTAELTTLQHYKISTSTWFLFNPHCHHHLNCYYQYHYCHPYCNNLMITCTYIYTYTRNSEMIIMMIITLLIPYWYTLVYSCCWPCKNAKQACNSR